MENRIGQDFESLAGRIAYSIAGTYPDFRRVKCDTASEQSQLDLYDFLKNAATKLYNDPAFLSLSMSKDDAYGKWELQKCKPKLITDMRTCMKRINEFYSILIQIGEAGIVQDHSLHVKSGDLKLTPNLLKRLAIIGLKAEKGKEETVFLCEAHPSLFPAWKLLAALSSRQKNPVLYFSRCMLDLEFSYPDSVFEKLTNDRAAYLKLRAFFEKNGYYRVNCRENDFSLDWVKNYGKKEEPLKGSWAEREHGGISILFDYTKRNQLFYGLRVPRYKELLAHFDDMDDSLKAFVISHTKHCDRCGYCTQTDKSGTRAKQCVIVNHEDGKHALCILYPGFSYIWDRIDSETSGKIISFLEWIDRLLSKEKKTKP